MAGGTCTPACSGGKVPAGACSIGCPPSIPDAGCTGDIPDNPWGNWWALCGYGDACATDMQLGVGSAASLGTFECVEPGQAGACVAVATAAPQDTGSMWDTATIVILAFCTVLVVIGAVAVRAEGRLRALYKPTVMLWTPASLAGVGLAIIGIVVYTIVISSGTKGTQLVFALGTAAGVAGSLPIWWAFMKAGVHMPMKMSREAAWKVHIIFGDLFLALGTAHGIAAIIEIDDVFGNTFWLLGFIGLVLMWVGVLPVALHYMKVITYDKFKLAHFASMLGYVLAIVHMLDHAAKFGTLRSIAVTLMNCLALLCFIAQKVYVKASAAKASVVAAEVTTEASGQHTFLTLRVEGFAWRPGQWGHLTVPSLSAVPHPFTIVPGANEGSVRFFIKASGGFTQALATTCTREKPKIILEGPYGEPALPAPHVQAVVFVVGGVGVTPALSLVGEASRQVGAKFVRFYWSLRSPALLQRCAPILEPHLRGSDVPSNEAQGLVAGAPGLQDGVHCVCGLPQADNGSEPLPLSAQQGHQDLAAWLYKTSEGLAGEGIKSALLFMCGPGGLTTAAKQAVTSQGASTVSWFVHQEEFRFLPASNAVGAKPPAAVKPDAVGNPSNPTP